MQRCLGVEAFSQFGCQLRQRAERERESERRVSEGGRESAKEREGGGTVILLHTKRYEYTFPGADEKGGVNSTTNKKE
jgi:hypothetical protein